MAEYTSNTMVIRPHRDPSTFSQKITLQLEQVFVSMAGDEEKPVVLGDDVEAKDTGDKLVIKKKKKKKKNQCPCMVLTVALGTPMAAEINRFRKFRDDHLVGNTIGEAVLHFYYGQDGARAVKSGEFISNHPWLARFLRVAVLKPLVRLLDHYQTGFVPDEYEESDGWRRFKDEHLATTMWDRMVGAIQGSIRPATANS